jgi:F-type H+-transporting ATPase subunit delta
VQVRSAVPLADDQADRLRQQLRESLRLDPVLRTEVDPKLLGGIVVKVGDWLYDASVRARLDSIRKQLIERSSHEIQSGRDRFSVASGN